MAFQLKENFKNKLKPKITSLVMQGTVQLTPSGKIIILMRDNQTCGGYPRILQLTENAINRLSQKHMNNNISFELFKGEVLGIVGESGSGKSTIAKCILDLIPLKDGKITFKGENILNVKDSIFRKKLQLIFQDQNSS